MYFSLFLYENSRCFTANILNLNRIRFSTLIIIEDLCTNKNFFTALESDGTFSDESFFIFTFAPITVERDRKKIGTIAIGYTLEVVPNRNEYFGNGFSTIFHLTKNKNHRKNGKTPSVKPCRHFEKTTL